MSIRLGLNISTSPRSLFAAFTAPAIAKLLFSEDEPGFFYDFDDWSTLFQDTAGTTPVTAPEQGVALALDKRLGSNFDARRNLLNRSEDFADSYWSKGFITVSVSPEPSPAGSAFLVSETSLSSALKSLFPASSVTAGLTYTGSWVLKKATTSAAPDWVRIQFRTSGFGSNLQPRANINLATGELGFVANGTASVADLGDGWYRVSITGTANATTGAAGIGLFFIQNTNSDNEFVGYVGDVNAAVLAAAPQMEVSPTVTPYQPTTTLPTSWAGNHATQATTADRPLTAVHPDGGVRNLLDRSEEFDNAVWGKPGATITANVAVAPDGTTTSDKLIEGTSSGEHRIERVISFEGVRTFSVYLKAEGRTKARLNVFSTTLSSAVIVDLETGSLSNPQQLIDASAIDVGNGWFRCSLSFNQPDVRFVSVRVQLVSTGSTFNYTGDGTSGIFIWGAQLEVGSTATPYQRRVNFLDVTESGKKSIRRLYFNGTSHFMTTPTITPNTDKAQVFAGVRRLSDVQSIITRLGISAGSNQISGSFELGFIGSDTYRLGIRRGNTTRLSNFTNQPAAPQSDVLSADYRVNAHELRKNGQSLGSVSAVATGDFSSQAMVIGLGSEGHMEGFFNGFLDQLINRFGPTPDETTIGKVEKYTSTKVPELVAASEVTWDASTDTYTQNLVGLGR